MTDTADPLDRLEAGLRANADPIRIAARSVAASVAKFSQAARLERDEARSLQIMNRRSPLSVSFTVRGTPRAQGVARAFVAGGKARIATDSNRPSSPIGAWRTAIANEARDAMLDRELMDGPVSVIVDFVMDRPKSHYRAGGALRLDAPRYHRSKPDADKLTRALLDAITGVVVHDDSQVAVLHVRKLYSGDGLNPGAVVTVAGLEVTR